MPSPFPGMDPYLEGPLWPDVHQRLAAEISRQLTPLIKPNYVARLAMYVVEDSTPEVDIGIMYPDVEVLAAGRMKGAREEATATRQARQPASQTIVPPLTLALLSPLEVRVPVVEIRDAAQNQLIGCIEIISPVNKRDEGLEKYRQKRRRLYEAAVHLLEIDLLRRGTRPVQHSQLPSCAYLITLIRANAAQIEAWPIGLRDQLPIVSVPLRSPDPDVALNLSNCLSVIYDEAAYDLSIDYADTPPHPPLSPEDGEWMKAILSQ